MNPAAFAVKQKNARRILDYIINNGETTRITLADTLELSAATVTNIVTELIEHGLLFESGQTRSSVGRKSTFLKFNSDAKFVVTLEIGTNKNAQEITVCACDLLGTQLITEDISCDIVISDSRTESAILKDLISLIQEFIQKLPSYIFDKLFGVGICVAGMVTAHQTVDMPIANWKNMNLVFPLQAALKLPVFVEGITRIMALYEIRFLDPSEKNVIYLNLSTGIGMVHFFNGKMVMGKNGIAGEIGHISLNPHGPRCFCGNRGCFELYCGMYSILKQAAELLTDENASDVFYNLVVNQKKTLTAELLFQAREQGSLLIHELFQNVSEYLGVGISTIYNIYDPDRVILTGYLPQVDGYVIDNARAEANSRIVNRFNRNIVLSRAHLRYGQLHLAISSFLLTKYLDTLYH